MNPVINMHLVDDQSKITVIGPKIPLSAEHKISLQHPIEESGSYKTTVFYLFYLKLSQRFQTRIIYASFESIQSELQPVYRAVSEVFNKIIPGI